MSLVTGSYAIRSAAFNNSFVGEGLGLRVPIPMPNPRPIISLPLESEPVVWNIEYIGADRYFLETESASAAIIDDLVYGVTLPRPLREEWHLIQLPQYDNQFLIKTTNGTAGWVLPEGDPYTQVKAIPLMSSEIFPPLFPLIERWIIESLD